MNTETKEMKALVEASGWKWEPQYIQFEDSDGITAQVVNEKKNPSPTDLNALVEIAEKLHPGGYEIKIGREKDYTFVVLDLGKQYVWMGDTGCEEFDTMPDALRKALFQSIKKG